MLVCLKTKYGISLKNVKYFLFLLSLITFFSSPVIFFLINCNAFRQIVAPALTDVANNRNRLGRDATNRHL